MQHTPLTIWYLPCLCNNLCFEQKYEKYQKFLAENFHFLVVKFSVYLNRRVFIIKNFAFGFLANLSNKKNKKKKKKTTKTKKKKTCLFLVEI